MLLLFFLRSFLFYVSKYKNKYKDLWGYGWLSEGEVKWIKVFKVFIFF